MALLFCLNFRVFYKPGKIFTEFMARLSRKPGKMPMARTPAAVRATTAVWAGEKARIKELKGLA
jgi:hypothetical protein